jgi:hypothetical protein
MVGLNRNYIIVFLAFSSLIISLLYAYTAMLDHPKYSSIEENRIWSVSEWKTAEYEADITAKASYNVASLLLQKSGEYSEEYIAQAKAWHDIRELARRGSLGYVSENEFTAKRQEVFKKFGLIIPDSVYEHAVYQTLLKWANWPMGFPSMISFEKFTKQLEENPEEIQRLKDDLKQLAFPKNKEPVNPLQKNSSGIHKPKTERNIVELLSSLNFEPETAITKFNIWFGDEEGGFASMLAHNLIEIPKTQWKNCWHPKWKLIGSCAQHTAIVGSDMDVLVVLNPHPQDAVNLEWKADGALKKVLLKDQELTTKRIVQLWDAFLKTCDHKLIQTYPGELYPVIFTENISDTPSSIQLSIGKTKMDLLPALRASDGIYLLFSVEGECANLVYSDAAQAARILEPYRQWENFPELIKLLKLLFREEWNTKYPRFPNSAFEKIAVEVANMKGRTEWENAQLIELLRDCLDHLIGYVDSNEPLTPLNNTHDELLALHRSKDLAMPFRSVVIKIKSYSTEKICDILQSVIDGS